MDVNEIAPIDIEKVQAENPQSRFRVVDNANLAPGVCALCGSAGGDGRQFVDFGKTMDWYGVVYFCTFCIGEAASLLGMIDGEKYRQLEEVFNSEWEAKRSLVADFRERLDAAMVLVRNCTCPNSGIGDRTSPIAEADIVDDGDSESEPESSNGDEPNPDEFDPIQGSDDIPADSSDDEPEPKPRSRTRKSTG